MKGAVFQFTPFYCLLFVVGGGVFFLFVFFFLRSSNDHLFFSYRTIFLQEGKEKGVTGRVLKA